MGSGSSDSSARETLIDRLQQVLARWPQPAGDDPSRGQTALEPYLAEVFEERDLLNKIRELSEILSVEVSGHTASIEFMDDEDCRQLARFERSQWGEWLLSSLKFECPACFGTGLTKDASCRVCGGTGWGAS
jgi:hypothetical protein